MGRILPRRRSQRSSFARAANWMRGMSHGREMDEFIRRNIKPEVVPAALAAPPINQATFWNSRAWPTLKGNNVPSNEGENTALSVSVPSWPKRSEAVSRDVIMMEELVATSSARNGEENERRDSAGKRGSGKKGRRWKRLL